MYPGFHSFWSRDWISDDGWEDAERGEAEGPRAYYDGAPPQQIPLPLLVGDAACIRDGENPALTMTPDDCERRGRLLPLDCYSVLADLIYRTNVWDCRFAYQCARILEKQYDDLDAAGDRVAIILGPDAVITKYPEQDDLIPNCIVAKVGLTCFVFVTGTTNYQQAAFQALYAGFGVTDIGPFSCNLAYVNSSNVITDHIGAAGGGDCNRFVLIGHSYGAATCYVLAARMLLAVPGRQVEMMSFGMPKSGDERLVALVDGLRQRHWVTEGDPVPMLPPRGATFADILGWIVPLLWVQWGEFRPPNRLAVLRDDGTIDFTQTEPIDWDILVTVAIAISAGLALPAFRVHNVKTYADRLRVACPSLDADCDEFPEDPYPPPAPYDLRMTSLKFTFEGTPYDLSIDFPLEWGWETDTYGGYGSGIPARLQFDPFGDLGSADMLLLIEFRNPLTGFFVYFLWNILRADIEAGVTITADPDFIDDPYSLTSFTSLGGLEFPPFDFDPN